jgi:cyclic lactone autoinducer peptide
MKNLFLKFVEKTLSLLAKQLVLTSCWTMCHRPEIPQELLKKQ